MKQKERPQKQKDNVRRVQELRMGSTTDRFHSPKDYRRKPKHVGRGWDE